MKKLLGIVVLGLLLSLNAKADNISDFQIEGISIGDSLLDFYDEKKIKSAKKIKEFKDNKYEGKKFKNSKEFNEIQFMYLSKDKTKIITGISAIEDFDNNLKKCKEERDSTIDSLKKLFKSAKLHGPKKKKHGRKAEWEGYAFIFKSGDMAVFSCYYSKKDKKFKDHLRISLRTGDYDWWLVNVAYK
tara:strand:- start:156 stop:716 length:561 start_codon:yes stop_codon:yes gene_type:complete